MIAGHLCRIEHAPKPWYHATDKYVTDLGWAPEPRKLEEGPARDWGGRHRVRQLGRPLIITSLSSAQTQEIDKKHLRLW